MQFFKFKDNTNYTHGFAEPGVIVEPPPWQVTDVLKCPVCGRYCGATVFFSSGGVG